MGQGARIKPRTTPIERRAKKVAGKGTVQIRGKAKGGTSEEILTNRKGGTSEELFTKRRGALPRKVAEEKSALPSKCARREEVENPRKVSGGLST